MGLFRRRHHQHEMPIITDNGLKMGPMSIVTFFICPRCGERIEMDSETLAAQAIAAAAAEKPMKSLAEILAGLACFTLNQLDNRGEFMVAEADNVAGISKIEGETIAIVFDLESEKWHVKTGRTNSA